MVATVGKWNMIPLDTKWKTAQNTVQICPPQGRTRELGSLPTNSCQSVVEGCCFRDVNSTALPAQAPAARESPQTRRHSTWGKKPSKCTENVLLPAAAAAAKSLQSCPTLCDPIDSSPPDSPVPGILQARTLEWVAISFSNAWKWRVKGKSLSHVRLLATPWTAAHQACSSMGFSREEYCSGVPLPSLMVYWRCQQSSGVSHWQYLL